VYLVLVHQDPAVAVPVVLQHLGMFLEEADRQHEEVAEVEGVALLQPLLVGAVNPGQRLPGAVAGGDFLGGMRGSCSRQMAAAKERAG